MSAQDQHPSGRSPTGPRFFNWVGLSLLLVFSAAKAEAPDIAYFSKPTEFMTVKISPDGKHLAVLTPMDGKNAIGILDTETLKPVYIVRFGEDKQVGEFDWANDERLIMSLQYFSARYEHPGSAGEWFATNLDGTKQRNIYGFRAGGKPGKIKSAEPILGYGVLVDLLEDDPKHILMSSTPFSKDMDRRPTLLRINIYTGKSSDEAIAPIPYSNFLTDHQGYARFVAGSTDEGNIEIYYREDENGDWQLMSSGSAEGGYVLPLAFVDEKKVYVQDNRDSSIAGVYILDPETRTKELVYRNETADPANYWFSDNGRKLYALEVEPLIPTYVYLDTQSAEVKLLRGLIAAFPGQQVRLESETRDSNLAVVRVFSDRNPGAFYLFNKSKKNLRHLVDARPWVDPEKSATIRPIEFTARDGMVIRGYLTLPPGKEARDLPLVVNPHGGPHGPRDWWGYNPETQFLASHGIAVLQVNFRGSGGYGRDFEKAGYRNWGSKIQYDIIDGTRNLVEQGIVNKDRICIYGGSFGGYSALQSSILAPDLFACAVGFAGVYDLKMMYELGDIPERESGITFLEKVIGQDDENMTAFSPVHNVDKLKAPVLLIHGEEDPRAPIEQAEELRDALEKKGHPYEWVVIKDEGHGFYNEKNREDMYKVLLTFLDKHLMPQAETVKQP
ncbi:MAG: S9 family peptidase [Gammaproteobacteria bacterium]|nr:S9 family peptidase [Gammaproteobacteria bacterium]